ncbi:alpha/beta fold hydrolase [Flavobacterium maritimum]|uniref:alpha/beta fold hydrolase n=1 Tax=Flavobacterium maritimum TaxID=3149042 RepID=UPI0032B4D133
MVRFFNLLSLCVLFTIQLQAQQTLHAVIKPSNGTNKVPYGNNPQAGHYVQSKDAKIYYEVYGKGQPIFLLHGGIMGSIDEMSEFINNLQPTYQVIAIATRGHGKSEIGTEPITYELKANDVMAVVNAVTKDSVTILGFSDGAYTAYKVASMYPERVKKMVAIGAGEQIPGLRKVVFSGEAFDLKNEFWKKKLALMPEPERIEEFWINMANFYNTMTASKELFSTIKCPVLVISGELDRNAPLATVINAYNMIPHSQLGIIPNTGHVVFIENFPAVWASIVPFLNQK